MSENHAHLKFWILEGSSNYGKNFASIDEVSDNNDINGNYKEKIFTLSKKVGPFNSFRLNTRNTHHDGYNYCMRLNEFDVYGSFLYARFSPKAKKKYLPKIFILLVIAIHIS